MIQALPCYADFKKVHGFFTIHFSVLVDFEAKGARSVCYGGMELEVNFYSAVQPQVQRNSHVHTCKLQLCVHAITCTCVHSYTMQCKSCNYMRGIAADTRECMRV